MTEIYLSRRQGAGRRAIGRKVAPVATQPYGVPAGVPGLVCYSTPRISLVGLKPSVDHCVLHRQLGARRVRWRGVPGVGGRVGIPGGCYTGTTLPVPMIGIARAQPMPQARTTVSPRHSGPSLGPSAHLGSRTRRYRLLDPIRQDSG